MVGDEPAIIFCFLRKHSMKPTKNIFVSFKYSLIETEKHCKGSIRLTEMLCFYLNEIPAIIFCFLRKHSMKPTKNIFVSFKYSLIETEKLSFYLNEIILKNKGVISYRLTSNLAEYVFDFLIKSNIKKIII